MTTKTEEKVRTQSEAAEVKQSAQAAAPFWHVNLWANAAAAAQYATNPPLSGPGTIEFSVMENGQVWTFDLR